MDPAASVRGTIAFGNYFNEGRDGGSPSWMTHDLGDTLQLKSSAWLSDLLKRSAAAFLLLLALLTLLLRGDLPSFLAGLARDIVKDTTSPSSISNRFVLVSLGILSVPCLLGLLPLHVLNGDYIKCGSPVERSSIQYLDVSQKRLVVELCLALLWTAHLGLALKFCISPLRPDTEESATKSKTKRKLIWVCWMVVAIVLSWPAVTFAFFKALPAQNTVKSVIGVNTWQMANYILPVLSAIMNCLVLPQLADALSEPAGIPYEALVTMAYILSVWLAPAAATVVMSEECSQYWRLFWSACQESQQDMSASISIPHHDAELFHLIETKDICEVWRNVRSQGRCARQIVHVGSKLVYRQLAMEASVFPALYVLIWMCSECTKDGHLRIRGLGWPAVTFTTKDYVVQLNLWLGTAVLWGPLIPLVFGPLFLVSLVNIILLRLETHKFGRCIENQKELSLNGMSRGFLKCAALQLLIFLVLFCVDTYTLGRPWEHMLNNLA